MRLTVRFFFFQAEDGIRDLTVTGVQTCALPIFGRQRRRAGRGLHIVDGGGDVGAETDQRRVGIDRKSTRLNSSHSQISYAVFCLKKKKKKRTRATYLDLDSVSSSTESHISSRW